MPKIQELIEDGSPRLDDNGNPIFQVIDDMTFYKLMETPIGKKLWRKVKDSIVLKEEIPAMAKVEERRKTARKKALK